MIRRALLQISWESRSVSAWRFVAVRWRRSWQNQMLSSRVDWPSCAGFDVSSWVVWLDLGEVPTEEMGPFHFPAFDLFVLCFGEAEALGAVLELEGDSVELDLCHDSSVLWSCSRVIQDPGAVVQVLGLHVDSTSVAEGRTGTLLARILILK